MSVSHLTPSALQAAIRDDLVRLDSIRERQEALADAMLESSFPPVGNSAADWDCFADGDYWALGPPIPPGTAVVPPELDDDFLPFLISATPPPDAAPPAAPPAEPPTFDLIRQTRKALRRELAALHPELPVCSGCKFVIFDGESDPFFPHKCGTCGINRTYQLIERAVRRHGRRKTLKALKRLGK